MRRDRDQRGAVGDGEPRQLDRLVEVGRAVVDPGEQVEVELGAHGPSTVTHAPAAICGLLRQPCHNLVKVR